MDSDSEKKKRTTGHVLVVDDELKNRELLEDLLEARGHTITTAENGEEALTAVQKCVPDVILLDVMMPRMDGFEACRRLKEGDQTAHIPVLMVTSLNDREDRLKGIRAGANDFLNKPVDTHDVCLRVANAIQAKRLYDRVQEDYKKLKELEDLRDNLVHMVIHDLRSPLSGVIGFAELLQMTATEKLTEREAEYLENIYQSGQQLNDMISSLLDVNRLESGEMPIQPEPCEIQSVINQAVSSVRGMVDLKNISLETHGEAMAAFCDVELVRRVIANLLNNALKYTPEGLTVEIISEQNGSGPKVSIRDSGPGIPAEYQDRIFEKFGQVEGREEKKKHSTGLGLTFCKLAIEAHGGRIGLDSEEGHGSTFWIELPEYSKDANTSKFESPDAVENYADATIG